MTRCLFSSPQKQCHTTVSRWLVFHYSPGKKALKTRYDKKQIHKDWVQLSKTRKNEKEYPRESVLQAKKWMLMDWQLRQVYKVAAIFKEHVIPSNYDTVMKFWFFSMISCIWRLYLTVQARRYSFQFSLTVIMSVCVWYGVHIGQGTSFRSCALPSPSTLGIEFRWSKKCAEDKMQENSLWRKITLWNGNVGQYKVTKDCPEG